MALTGSYRSLRLYVLIWRMIRRVFRVTSVYQNISYCIKADSADLFPAEKGSLQNCDRGIYIISEAVV